MVSIADLWLPILLSSVAVFVASSVLHTVLPFHKKDHGPVDNEAAVLEGMRNAGVKPGDYVFPYAADPKEMGTPEMVEKLNLGPKGFMTIMPNGPWAMGAQLVQWFLYCVGVSVMAAYVAGRALGPAAEYLAVFRFACTAAVLAYSGAHPSMSIWFKRRWSTTLRFVGDGLLYALLTAGMFGWLWPE